MESIYILNFILRHIFVFVPVKDPDFNSRERFAKAVQIVFEIGRSFLFKILIIRKRTMEELTITLGAVKLDGQLKNHVQRCILKAARKVTPDDFDMSIVYAVLRKGQILDGKETPSKGWGKEPIEANAIRLGDDVERLRILRNKLCHGPLASMTLGDFDAIVKEVKDVAHRWSSEIGMKFLSDIDRVVNNGLTISDVNKTVDKFITEIKRAAAQGTCEMSEMNIQTMVTFKTFLFHYVFGKLSVYSISC